MTQLETIKELLIKNGKISRNQCLRDFISCRLSAYILDLKHEGWEFNAHNEGGDYVYEVVKRPELFMPYVSKINKSGLQKITDTNDFRQDKLFEVRIPLD